MPTEPSADPRLRHMIDAALAGARIVMPIYWTDFSVAHKVDDLPVSEADLGSEHAIGVALAAAMPDVPIVAEEAASAGALPTVGQSFLLVDPLDGTKEFISRNGEFTINVALVEDAVPVAGVVLAPALGLAYAGSGKSAWKGTLPSDLRGVEAWTPIHARRALEHPVAVVSRSHMNPATATALAQAACGEHRSIGSSLKFGLLAEGEADFYPRLGPTMEWDTAAGDAVLRAAGGAVVTLDVHPPSLRQGQRSQDASFRKPAFPRARRRDAAQTPRPRCARTEQHEMSGALVLSTKGLEDYALVDSGHGRKLERFGTLLLDRPEEQAMWRPRLDRSEWEKADAVFTGDVDEEGAGRWKRRAGVPDAWTCKHGALRYECRFTSFRHVGAFPEQEAHFAFMRDAAEAGGRNAVAPQPLRLYRARLAGRGRDRRGSDACRRLQEGDRLGAREPGAFGNGEPADPLAP